MRIAHKIGVLLAAIALLVILLLLPRHGQGQSVQDFGDYIVHYSAITTNQLVGSVAKQYGIERSDRRGLLNIAVEAKTGGESRLIQSNMIQSRMIRADVSASVGDLSGHVSPVHLRETSENGDIDYLGEFPLTGSGSYMFNVKVIPPGGTRPYVVKFSRDYVVD
jgi:hypothetical protein